ncbi:MAG TPA: hypothetical protein VGE04_02825 [Chloroflexia bacterium]|jgi:hypothetical protein
MSTRHFPNPPDQPTSQAQDANVQGQTSPSTQPMTEGATPSGAQAQATPPAQPEAASTPQASGAAPAAASVETPAGPQVEAPLPLHEDVARIIEAELGTIAQKMVYHCQLLFGVGGIGTDPVTARDGAYYIAQAVREQSPAPGVHALVNLGDAQIVQVNDRTFPYKFNAQAAGLLEGIVTDTIAKAYSSNPARREAATRLLNSIFLAANDQLQRELKVIPMMGQAPAFGQDYQKLLDLGQAGTQAQQAAETQG